MAGAVVGGVASIAGAALSKSSTGGTGADKQAVEVQKDQLNFDKQQYADWKAVYGDLQTNISNYYKNLTPDKLATMGLQNQAEAFSKAKMDLTREFAQRGIDGSSPFAADERAKLALQNATTRAGIRTSAPQAVIDAKTGFLSLGLGQGAQLAGNVGQASRGISQTLQAQAQRQADQTLANQKAQNSYITTGLDNFQTAVGSWVARNS